MSVVQLEEDMEVMVDYCGVITFIIDDRVCFVNLHPTDTAKLIKFLEKSGYTFYK